MDKNEKSLFDAIQAIVYDVAGVRNVTMDTDLVRDLSLNSFDVASLLNAVEGHFDMEIPIRDVWSLNQVKDIVEYLSVRLKQRKK
ncbi:MAG: acyl carrier protein [Christensenellales bacterium]